VIATTTPTCPEFGTGVVAVARVIAETVVVTTTTVVVDATVEEDAAVEEAEESTSTTTEEMAEEETISLQVAHPQHTSANSMPVGASTARLEEARLGTRPLRTTSSMSWEAAVDPHHGHISTIHSSSSTHSSIHNTSTSRVRMTLLELAARTRRLATSFRRPDVVSIQTRSRTQSKSSPGR
jgi:hypothetical protein